MSKTIKYEPDAQGFAKALKLLKLACATNSTIPILRCLKITYSQDTGFTLTGTDLDQELTIRLSPPLMGEQDPLDVCIPHDALYNFLRTGDGPVTFATPSPAKITIACGAASTTLATRPVTDFPTLKPLNANSPQRANFSFANAALASAIDFAKPAISAEATRYYLNGIYLQLTPAQSTATATDGHRLHTSKTPCQSNATWAGIIPQAALTVLQAALALGHDVEAQADDSRVAFAIGPYVTLKTKLIDGTFPDYDRLIPTLDASAITWTLAPRPVLTALKRLSAGVKIPAIRLSPTLAGRGAILSCKSEDAEKSENLTDAAASHGGVMPADISMNAKLLAQALTAFGAAPSVTLRQDQSPRAPKPNEPYVGNPMLLTAPSQPDRRIVLMPMRV